jgi:hypothetical protein
MEENINISVLPKGVKIISILGIILSIPFIFIGLWLTASGFLARDLLVGPDPSAFLGVVFGPICLVPSVATLVFCIFTLKRKNWARIALGVFTLISGGAIIGLVNLGLVGLLMVLGQNKFFGLVSANPVSGLVRGIFFPVLTIFIFWYLLFNKKVKEAFNIK